MSQKHISSFSNYKWLYIKTLCVNIEKNKWLHTLHKSKGYFEKHIFLTGLFLHYVVLRSKSRCATNIPLYRLSRLVDCTVQMELCAPAEYEASLLRPPTRRFQRRLSIDLTSNTVQQIQPTRPIKRRMSMTDFGVGTSASSSANTSASTSVARTINREEMLRNLNMQQLLLLDSSDSSDEDELNVRSGQPNEREIDTDMNVGNESNDSTISGLFDKYENIENEVEMDNNNEFNNENHVETSAEIETQPNDREIITDMDIGSESNDSTISGWFDASENIENDTEMDNNHESNVSTTAGLFDLPESIENVVETTADRPIQEGDIEMKLCQMIPKSPTTQNSTTGWKMYPFQLSRYINFPHKSFPIISVEFVFHILILNYFRFRLLVCRL